MIPFRILFLLSVLPLTSCSTFLGRMVPSDSGALYKVETVRTERGIASWYDDHRTASGERFDVQAMTAAHRKLPFGTKVRVVDLKTEKSVIVRINDRGPYIRGRIIDLTIGAARKLGMYHRGIAKVRVEVLREIPVMRKPNLRAAAKPARSVPPERREVALAGKVPSRTAMR
jgi:rare lipoprotein A